MADLFTTAEVIYDGAIHSQKGIITSSVPGMGILMQNMQLQYSQQITRLYELGIGGQDTFAYYVAGRAQGQIQAGHVVGPNVALKAYYSQYGNVCNASKNTITLDLSPNTCDVQTGGTSGKLAYKCKNCVLSQVGFSVSVQDYLINENSTLMFIGMEYTGN
jgi:hypothetical protein